VLVPVAVLVLALVLVLVLALVLDHRPSLSTCLHRHPQGVSR